MNKEEFAKNEIFSELDAILERHKGEAFAIIKAYEDFLEDFYDCYHVIDYKKKYADEWLAEICKKVNETI